MKKIAVVTALLMSVGATPALAAIGDTVTFKFDLPSTASFGSGYPVVAELKLTETASGVVTFELTPNWASPGFADPSDSTVNHLEFVYQGPASPTFAQPLVHGADIKTFDYHTNPNMDSGYKSDDQYISIDWFKPNQAERFDGDYANSIWTISGTGVDITDFTGTLAHHTAGKPDPIFGIISVDPYSLTDPHPTPSNWVTSAVPEPETYAMLLAGLGLLGFSLRNKKA
ncbi:PEP-CTERM sorting domain-containing protein [Nitrosomonas sp.]|uniref:PEP-CTERM sorting domain-containing protein n=1 Tax=Nitrosomonas sp. TaxID=42353 RepID=UPI0035AF8C9A